jgi:predicted SAM-dependent methyltransferase
MIKRILKKIRHKWHNDILSSINELQDNVKNIINNAINSRDKSEQNIPPYPVLSVLSIDIKNIIPKGPIKLHLGCGTVYKEGWINVDNNSDNNIQKIDINWDLRMPLPFPDNSADFIYNEHFLEHLTVEEGISSIKDYYRVLKPGGVMRIAMPDLENIILAYNDLNWKENNKEFLEKFGLTFIQTRAERININFRWWGHKWLYDWEELERRLKEAGCEKIKRCTLFESEHEELKNLETLNESTLIAEVTKVFSFSDPHTLDNNQLSLKPTPFHLYMMSNINLLITEHCTLTCTHCSTGAPFANKKSHSVELFCKWLDILQNKKIPFKSIALTGGEPFLHPEVLDGSFIQQLKTRYPSKRIGLTTNFFWASEKNIIKYAPVIGMLGGCGISKYKTIVEKLGGIEKFDRLIRLLKDMCPNTEINVHDQQNFSSWEFHEGRQEVKGICVTSDCFILTADGKLSHCSLAIGAKNISKFNTILETKKEAFFDLSKLEGKDEFLLWQEKYPFDLCFHCTMWLGKSEPWHLL